MNTNKFAYFDNINMTQPAPEVIDIINKTLNSPLGNPSSHIHSAGLAAANIIDEAREKVSLLVNSSYGSVLFTSGATEANNIAITGFFEANSKPGFVCSNIEHFSILNQITKLRRKGIQTDIIDVDEAGLVDPAKLESVLKKRPSLVSIALANPEIGTIQDIKEIADICHSHGSVFHCDATAGAGLVPIDIEESKIDLLTLSAHNMHGPPGVGALYLGKNIKVASLFEGGNQELGIRPGTENIPGIAGFGMACELAKANIGKQGRRLEVLGQNLWSRLEESVQFIRFTGHKAKRIPGHVSFWVEHIEGESLLLLLSMNGVMASSGSACSSNLKAKDEDELMASHVLDAVGVPSDICSGSITLSAGWFNSEDDFEYVGSVIPGLVEKLLSMSPSYDDYIKNKETTDG